MKYLVVTGATGFIGWRVTKRLLTQGYRVLGLDNMNNAYDVRLKRWRLQQLEKNMGFEFAQVDIVDREELRSVLASKSKPSGIDAIIHLAARAGVRDSVTDPWAYYMTNVIGTLNVLDTCRALNIPKLVFASSSSVYGRNQGPFHEDQAIERPLSPYAASKGAAESLCYAYHYLYSLDVSVLRFFTVYGPAGRPDMSYFRFIKWIAEGEPCTIYGDGAQRRDFTYVDDIAEGVVAALRSLEYEVINLAGGRPASLHEVIALLERFLGKKAILDYRPVAPADVVETWADVTKARRVLGWHPRTKLEDGLYKTVNWYLENRTWARKIHTAR